HRNPTQPTQQPNPEHHNTTRRSLPGGVPRAGHQSASCIPSGLCPILSQTSQCSVRVIQEQIVPGAVRLSAFRIPSGQGEHYGDPGAASNRHDRPSRPANTLVTRPFRAENPRPFLRSRQNCVVDLPFFSPGMTKARRCISAGFRCLRSGAVRGDDLHPTEVPFAATQHEEPAVQQITHGRRRVLSGHLHVVHVGPALSDGPARL
ncbi:MAG: hypothetical protein JWN52_5008, partial [Actinomycetia bacterium]|nr:hypothetical protein [Actinomycetes bacterium]